MPSRLPIATSKPVESGRQKALQLPDRHRQVGVADEAVLAAGRQESRLDGAAFPPMRLALHDDTWLGACALLDDGRRPVARAVVHHADVPVPGLRAQERDHRCQRAASGGALR